MVRPARIALVAKGAASLEAALGGRNGSQPAPRVQLFRDLYEDAEELLRYRPTALVIDGADLEPERLGALRMLRASLPDAGLVLIGVPGGEENAGALADLVAQAGVEVLARPVSADELATAVRRAAAPPTQAMSESLLDLVRGISDEINNPLMVTAGYVQLLEARLDPEHNGNELELLGHIRAGVDRVSETMAKIRLLTRAGDAGASGQLVDLSTLTRAAAKRAADRTGRTVAAPPEGREPVWIDGHGGLLEGMLEQLCASGVALLDGDGEAVLRLETEPGRVRIELALTSTALPSWRLTRTFEPYYLNRVMRGTPEGLSLFLVQLVAQSHGGRALASWRGGGGVALRVELPRD